MKLARCEICGGFYDPREPCPNTSMHPPPPPPPPPAIGTAVTYDSAVYVVVSEPDEDGTVGLSPLHERVRVQLQDVEEI